MSRSAIAGVCVALAVIAAAPPARADEDYGQSSQEWNGLASLVGLAEGMGFEVAPATVLEWGDLGANDILVIVYPLQRVDPGKLSAFVSAGGHVLIADDFGEARDAINSLGVMRSEPNSVRAARYQNDLLWAPIATARGDHPIARDVGDVVTNHPAALTDLRGADAVVSFDDSHLVVAGERGSGRFIVLSDPSVLINRMLQNFAGNVQLAANMLRWLDRGGRARRVVLLHGDAPMYGDPKSLIDDPKAGSLGRQIAALNNWLSDRRAWLLTPTAMKVLATLLAITLLGLALLALPIRRGPKIDGAWLKFGRPIRRDEPSELVLAADRGTSSNLVVACILRDHVQVVLAGIVHKLEPLYTVPEPQLFNEVAARRGAPAAAALNVVYHRLRALPSRGQAAAPWSTAQLAARDFDQLYRDVAALCRTLGSDLPGAPRTEASPIPKAA